MAAVPGPRPDRPLPAPGFPAEPDREEEQEEERRAAPEETPSWEPEPYDPEREYVEEPLAVP
jgi:hypothetical protein